MVFQITPDVEIGRDEHGVVRQLRHPRHPFSAMRFATAPTPRELADQYLEEVAEIMGLHTSTLANLAGAPEAAPAPSDSELRFKEEKSLPGQSIVSYAQTHAGIPIWSSGITVRMRNQPTLEVTGSQNEFQYDVSVELPSASAAYLPEKIDPSVMCGLLAMNACSGIKINSAKLFIYKYDPTERTDPEAATAPKGERYSFGSPVPTLPLPTVPENIVPGKYYVVTEALFTMALPDSSKYNWRALVEAEKGTILYLRALVACAATGYVFPTDPITRTGRLMTAASPDTELDALRLRASLEGLALPSGNPPIQQLEGEFVKLVDFDSPYGKPPCTGSPFDFCYSAKTQDFAAANAYCHCDGLFRLVEGMGFDVRQYFDGTIFPVPVEFYGMFGEVNARAPGNENGDGSGGFEFGIVQEGQGMGIAADARVVLHEFGHALLWDHVGSPNFGFCHSPGDSLGAILHDPESRARDRFSTFPFMEASSGIARRHDRSVAEGWAWGGTRDDRQYGSEQILSTTMFRIYRVAGGDSKYVQIRLAASRYLAFLIIKAVGSLTFTTRDQRVFVDALVDADASTTDFEGMPGDTLGKVIRWSFEKQGLYQQPGSPRPVTGPGAPPDVDVYIYSQQHGEYDMWNDDLNNTLGIWNRQAADDGEVHEKPTVGATNYLYVRIGNRGTSQAKNVSLTLYKSEKRHEHVWPNDWAEMMSPPMLVGTLSSRSTTVVGPIEWTPTGEDKSVLAKVTADGDSSNSDQFSAGRPVSNSRLVPFDNNLAQRSV